MPSSVESADPRVAQLETENLRLRRAVDELSVLNDLATTIGGSLDTDAIMRSIVQKSLKTVGAEQGVVSLLDTEAAVDPLQTLVRTMSSSGEHEALNPSASVVGWMMKERKPLMINEPREDVRFSGTRWAESIRSILAVPLIVQSRLIGVLTIFNKRAETGFTVEDQRLLAILASQSAQILDNARLHEEEQKLAGFQRQLELARDIQTRLLPTSPPRAEGYDVAGMSIPAQLVGGDFYDFLACDDHRFAMWLGDVACKGLPASLTMANTQATLRGLAPLTGTVEALTESNRLLCQFTPPGTFVTMFYAVLDIRKHQLEYGNAGHNRPLYRTAGGDVSWVEHGDLVLGCKDDYAYQTAHLTFAPGDWMLLYSDGVVEAMNTDRDLFGDDTLRDLFASSKAETADALMTEIESAVQTHAGAAEAADDITLLVVRRA